MSAFLTFLGYLLLALLCSVFYTFFSFLILCFISSLTGDEIDYFGDNFGKFFVVNTILLLIIFIVFRVDIDEDNSNNIVSNQTSQIEELQTENDKLQEDLSSTQSQLEDTQAERDNAQDLVKILQEQLLSYGIDPDDL